MKRIKLKIKATDIRILSEFYDISIQSLARKAQRSWVRECHDFTGDYDKIGTDTTTIDVSDHNTPAQWREMIDFYCKREIAKLPEALEFALKTAKRTAQVELDNLPKFTEVK